MKRLTDLIGYIKNKLYIIQFTKNSDNYMGKPKTLLATSKYCNAVVDTIIYENS